MRNVAYRIRKNSKVNAGISLNIPIIFYVYFIGEGEDQSCSSFSTSETSPSRTEYGGIRIKLSVGSNAKLKKQTQRLKIFEEGGLGGVPFCKKALPP